MILARSHGENQPIDPIECRVINDKKIIYETKVEDLGYRCPQRQSHDIVNGSESFLYCNRDATPLYTPRLLDTD